MAEFDPVPPPLDLPAAPPVLSPNIPLNPPMVGEASPWLHVDGQNRDFILEAIRTWVRVSLLPWTTSWQDQLTDWEGATADQLDAWLLLVDAYITEHAVAGLSFRSTETPIANAGTTNVVLVVDTNLRPLVIGDLVIDQAVDGNYGIITAIIDDTHATVAYIGTLRGPNGLSFRVTASTIAGAGTSDVVLPVVDGYAPLLGDLVLNETSGTFGQITAIADPTHATVTFLGAVAGPAGASGLSIRYTASAIAGTGSSDVVLPVVVNFPAELGDLVLDTGSGNAGTITVITDATHVSVTYAGNLKGVNGTNGIVSSVVAGENVTVNNADPANPIITANGSFTFRNYPNLNDSVTADGNTVEPISGSIGVVFPDSSDQFIASTWIFYEGHWTAPVFYVANNLAKQFGAVVSTPNWDEFIAATVNPDVHTNLDMTAATLVEGVNGTRARWNTTAGRFAPDPSALRGNGLMDAVTPAGSVVANPNGSYTLTACTELNLNHWLPTLALEGTDEATLKISGVMAENGTINVRLAQHNNGPDTSASYGGYGRTLNYTSASTLGYDADYASPGPTDTGWTIVTDSTNSPTMVEATLNMKNLGSPSIASIGKLHSIYRTPDFSQVFERDFTYYNVLNVGGANPFRIPDGLDFIFTQPFTGTISLESNFA